MIYMDVLVALNWFLDYALLCGTARLLHIACKRRRLVLGSLCGALLSAVLVLPTLPRAVALPLRLLSAVPVVWAAFGKSPVKRFLARLAAFFLLSTALAGVVLAAVFWLAPKGLRVINGVVYYDVPPLLLALLTALFYGILCLYERGSRLRRFGGEYRLRLRDGGGERELRALYDSGNRLVESFSGRPVIVADRSAVLPLLTEEQRQWLSFADGTDVPAGMPPGRFRLIPFDSVGGKGLLPAFCPAEAVLTAGKRRRDITGVYIALSDRLGRGGCEALLGADVVSVLSDREA